MKLPEAVSFITFTLSFLLGITLSIFSKMTELKTQTSYKLILTTRPDIFIVVIGALIYATHLQANKKTEQNLSAQKWLKFKFILNIILSILLIFIIALTANLNMPSEVSIFMIIIAFLTLITAILNIAFTKKMLNKEKISPNPISDLSAEALKKQNTISLFKLINFLLVINLILLGVIIAYHLFSLKINYGLLAYTRAGKLILEITISASSAMGLLYKKINDKLNIGESIKHLIYIKISSVTLLALASLFYLFVLFSNTSIPFSLSLIFIYITYIIFIIIDIIYIIKNKNIFLKSAK